MSTTTDITVRVRPATVGTELPAAAVMRNDLILIEEHVVQGIRTGPREVAAIVLRSFMTPENLAVIEWAGAVPGEHISTGASVYESSSPVTVLRLGGVPAVAA